MESEALESLEIERQEEYGRMLEAKCRKNKKGVASAIRRMRRIEKEMEMISKRGEAE